MSGTANSGGRNRRSRQAHLLAGTFRPSRHGTRTDAEPPPGRPRASKLLRGLALQEWRLTCARLAAANTLSKVDDACIYQYSQLFAETERLAEDRAATLAALQLVEDRIGEVTGPDLVACVQEITKMRVLVARYGTALR